MWHCIATGRLMQGSVRVVASYLSGSAVCSKLTCAQVDDREGVWTIQNIDSLCAACAGT